jgi:hypothetical protein
VAAHTVYKLYRIEGEGRVEVSAHKTLGEGFSAGQDAVHADPESAFALYLKGLNGVSAWPASGSPGYRARPKRASLASALSRA